MNTHKSIPHQSRARSSYAFELNRSLNTGRAMGKRARRFNLSWPVQIKVTGSGQIEFEEEGCLQNISSSGALLSLNAPIEIGAKAKLFIKLPSKDDKWMRYYGEVVRSETVSQKVSVAVKFSSARPAFCRTKD